MNPNSIEAIIGKGGVFVAAFALYVWKLSQVRGQIDQPVMVISGIFAAITTAII